MTRKPQIMVLTEQRPIAMEQLARNYELHRFYEAEDKPAFVAEHGAACRAIVTSAHAPLDGALVAAMPQLEIVCCSSAGFDEFDLAALAGRGIALTNTSPALREDVADTAILLMLAARRNLVAADAYVRSGDWGRKGAFPLQRGVAGRRLGVVGMGTIGRAIAERATALGMEIAYWNRSAKDVPWTHQPDLVQLARDSDILVAIVAGGAGTRGLISEEVLSALGPESLFVNVARGTVVDEAALIATLTDGRLGSAALDVYENEPNPDPALTGLPNVTLLPHSGSATVETRDAMGQLAVDNLNAHFAGKPLLSPVDLSPWAPSATAEEVHHS